MAIPDEHKNELFGLLDEWADTRESKKAEEEAKREAELAKQKEGETEGETKKTFAERLLGL